MVNFFEKAKLAKEAKEAKEATQNTEEPLVVEAPSALTSDTSPPPEEKAINANSFFNKKATDANVKGSKTTEDKPASTGASKDFGQAFAKHAAAPMNNILEGIELPDPPPSDASDEDLLKYQLEKLALVVEHPIAARDTMAALHDQLKSTPELKELLMPEHLGLITQTMGMLTSTAHGKAVAKKTKAVKAKVVKEEKKKEVDDLADEFSAMMGG